MIAEVLSQYLHLLPAGGSALDLACGRGVNAIELASRGFAVEAWDRDAESLAEMAAEAHSRNLPVQTQLRDVELLPPEPDSFSVICVSHFLYRPICGALMAALVPGGLLFYQTFTAERVEGSGGPRRPAFRLQPNELLRLFGDLRLVAYREERLLGDTDRGWRNKALLVGQRVVA